jgi:superfamily II DNA or RNA helicase
MQLSVFEQYGDIELKPLQKVILQELRNEMVKGTKRIVLQAATGLGKTVIAAQIIKNALEKGKSVLFIVDRIVLANQTSDVLRRYGIPHGVLQGKNERFDISQPCQVCSIQTVKMRGVNSADLIIIDEAHVLHKAHIDLMQENPEAYVIGLTATPYAKGMGKHFEKHIEPFPVKELISQGYLVPFDIYGPAIVDLSRLKVKAGEYTEESNYQVFGDADIVGDVIGEWEKIAKGLKTIVFGVNVAHIKYLSDRFNAAGYKSCQINAYQTEEERIESLDGFLYGDTMVLCSVEVATKGFDCPSVECCVLAVATRSMIKWTQTTGRALRTFPGKEKAIMLDFGGNAERLGFPDDFQFFGLDDGKKKKSSPSDKEKQEPMPKACPVCSFIKPIGVRKCPACGFLPEHKKDVESAEGNLAKLQRKSRLEYTIEQKQEWLAMANQWCADRKMKRHRKGFYGAAIYAYADKFGCRPSGKVNWSAMRIPSEDVKKYMIHRMIKYAKRKQETF